eukprot:CAMPEP_0174262676 /NCGR_PEP_ID=MMETSP0439-20130205/14514_1 /TAXON_ID=0 /ORGANISM="Stereomyxa ramosa, Strain Chinc5" /LENGTH=486 /DNA_ID=CAMNT_0015347527 /DNA_START=40 /DNA_END=1497 /DNA_ORIENTATION=+
MKVGEVEDEREVEGGYWFVDNHSSPAVSSLLSSPVSDWLQLRLLLVAFLDLNEGPKERSEYMTSFSALKVAITEWTKWMTKKTGTDYDFYRDLLPTIIKWCCEFKYNKPVPLLAKLHAKHDRPNMLHHVAHKVVFSPQEALFFMANAFFLNVRSLDQFFWSCQGDEGHSEDEAEKGEEVQTNKEEEMDKEETEEKAYTILKKKTTKQEKVVTKRFGALDWQGIYMCNLPASIQRLFCQFSYFHQCEEYLSTNPENIVFIRLHSKDEKSCPEWKELSHSLEGCQKSVRVHTHAMEESKARSFVDFANAQLHIGRIIPSFTQEEVLFSVCPEAFLGLLFTERLGHSEAMIIQGIHRFSDYTGYLSTFRMTDFYDPPFRVVDTLVLDAVLGNQYTLESIYRDITKAYLTFLNSKEPLISTGHWGCGAFGGDKTLKFLQQVCAAVVSGVTIEYSTYKDKELAEEWKEMLKILGSKNSSGQFFTVGDVVSW